MGCFIAGVFILLAILLIIEYPIPAILILVPSVYFFIKAMKENSMKEKRGKEIHSVPKNTFKKNIIQFKYGYDVITNREFEIWLEGEKLCFFGTVSTEQFIQGQYTKVVIPTQNINFFTRLGDMYTETNGGGTSIGGALVGGVVAGEAGAIIGSRGNVETKVVDKRETIMEVIDDKNKIEYLRFESSAYDIFLKLIPSKEKSLVKNQESNNRNESNIDSDEIVNRIEKVKELKEKGIITEEEYNIKKNELLSKI